MRLEPRTPSRAAIALWLGAAPALAQTSPADIPGDALLPPRAEREAPSDDADGAHAAFAVDRSLRDLLAAPLVTREGDELWVRTRDSRGRFVADGFSLYPVFGPAAATEQPVHFTLAGASHGARAFDTTPLGGPVHTADRVELRRAEVLESYRLDLDGFEQMFTFDALPGAGDLVVDLTVETDLAVVAADGDLRFVDPTLGEVRYGEAIAFDAAGRRVAVARRWTGAGIELRVPAAFVAGATLPLTIDPVIATFRSTFGVADDGSADLVYCPVTDEYLVAWEEYTSATNSDVYATKFSRATQIQSAALAVEQGLANWTDPRVAYANGHDRVLVVATVNPNGVGGVNGSVGGCLVDPTALATVGSTFTISTVGAWKSGACVGGNSRTSATQTYFCVAWSARIAAGDSDLQYRIVDGDGAFITGIVDVDTTAANDVQPAISASQGDTTLSGDYWTLAWVRDSNDDGRGQVWARRVGWNGSTALGAGNFVVSNSANAARPSVTSRFDEGLQVGGDRPSVVAYDVAFGSAAQPSGLQRSVYLQAVTDGVAHETVGLSSILEDFDLELDQWAPSIRREGKGFFVSYAEEAWSAIGQENWDMYFAAGAIVDRGASVEFALSERHSPLAAGSAKQLDGRVGSLFDSDADTTEDDAAVIWTVESATPGFGELRGALLDSRSVDVLPQRAVGVQFCDANPNSVGTYGGRNSSWLWIDGTRSVNDLHTVYAVDLPVQTFGYLLVSATTGSVDLAGGGQGRLCLANGIGRYVNAISSSGPSGVIATTVDPQAIPQPVATVSASAGYTWNFQLWHRDSVLGVATSNFTNACALTFTP